MGRGQCYDGYYNIEELLKPFEFRREELFVRKETQNNKTIVWPSSSVACNSCIACLWQCALARFFWLLIGLVEA